ncbi:hypothetical protein ACIQC5_03320 [Paenarthrobacter sp. NPDC092416]|uniref:hypothetical protein n=1 Tax=Paenarthrobacter sp. NPDC092416 TaxID=3364386 RepID=UPI003825A27C
MRWDSLFDDIESQFFSENALAGESEVTERARVEMAGIELADRLRGAVGTDVALLLVSGSHLRGGVSHVGGEWLVLNEGMRQWLVPHASIVSYQGLGRLAQKVASPGRPTPGLASALRGLARDRAEVTAHLLVGFGGEQQLSGVIDRVGADHFDLAVLTNGEVRRSGNVASVVTVPFTALAAMRSSGRREL